jgi:hypothetical protein
MRERALVIAALPEGFSGPEVSLEDGEKWEIVPAEDYHGAVEIEIDGAILPLHADAVEVSGKKARIHVRDSAASLGVERITVDARQVA